MSLQAIEPTSTNNGLHVKVYHLKKQRQFNRMIEVNNISFSYKKRLEPYPVYK